MYENYLNYIVECNKQDLETSSFKRDPRYTPILEHVNFEQGNEYLQCIMNEFPYIQTSDIIEYCQKNDSIGNPFKYTYNIKDSLFDCSPTSIRYIYHALLILTTIQSHPNKKFRRIVELGCGYGGLFLAVHFFRNKYLSDVRIDHYYLMDLCDVNTLIYKYLKLHGAEKCASYSFIDSSSFGQVIRNDDDDLFFVSNYCLTELPDDLRYKYYKLLLPKCSGGFIIWQTWISPLSETIFLKDSTHEIERPQTSFGNPNYFVRF